MATDSNGQSKGHGFVQFEQESSAQIAIVKVNGMLLKDKQVYVGPFIRRQERERDSGLSRFNNIYIKNLAETTTEDDLKRIFGVHGAISSAVIMRDADGKSKCFGFVNFDHAEDAAKAVEALNGNTFNDKEWYVGRAQKKSEREAELKAKFEQDRKARIERYQGVNLYLKNLDDSVDDEKLRELFSEFGTITSYKVRSCLLCSLLCFLKLIISLVTVGSFGARLFYIHAYRGSSLHACSCVNDDRVYPEV